MAETSEEKKLSLKLMIDKTANKVVFAEANKEFVDFLFGLMSIPLSTVTKLLLSNDKGMVGTLGALYKSIESLDGTECFKSNIDSDSVFKPRASVTVPLLSLHDCYYDNCVARGDNRACQFIVTDQRVYSSSEFKKHIIPSEYVSGSGVYMVMDNLEVKPMSISLIKSVAKKFDVLEEMQVQVGLQEGLDILKASLETSTVLSNVFRKMYYDSDSDIDIDIWNNYKYKNGK